MPEYLGVDIGSEWLSIAVVSKTKGGPVIRALNRYQYAEAGGDVAARATFAAKTVAEGPHARLPIAVSVSGAEVFLRPLVVPFTKASQVARTLKFEMEGHLPFDVDTAVLDYSVVSTGEKSSTLLVAAIVREALDHVVAAFQSAGLAVKMVSADVLTAPVLGAFLAGRRYGVLDVSVSAWKLAVCGDGRLDFVRAAAAAPAGDRMETALSGWFKQSLMAAPHDTEIERLYVVGEMSGALDCQALEDSLGIPVSLAKFPSAALDGGLLGDADEVVKCGVWAVAAAARLATGRADFDLYGAAYGRQGPLDKVLVPAMVFLCLFSAFFVAIGWAYARELSALRANVAALGKAETELWQRLFADEKVPSAGVYGGLQAKVRDLEDNALDKMLGGRAGPVLKSILAVSIAAKSNSGLEFLKFEAREGKFTIDARAPNDAAAEQLANDLSASGMFDATVKDLNTDNDRVIFKVTVTPRG